MSHQKYVGRVLEEKPTMENIVRTPHFSSANVMCVRCSTCLAQKFFSAKTFGIDTLRKLKRGGGCLEHQQHMPKWYLCTVTAVVVCFISWIIWKHQFCCSYWGTLTFHSHTLAIDMIRWWDYIAWTTRSIRLAFIPIEGQTISQTCHWIADNNNWHIDEAHAIKRKKIMLWERNLAYSWTAATNPPIKSRKAQRHIIPPIQFIQFDESLAYLQCHWVEALPRKKHRLRRSFGVSAHFSYHLDCFVICMIVGSLCVRSWCGMSWKCLPPL